MNWTRWIIVGAAVLLVAGMVFLAGRGDLLFAPPPSEPEERGRTIGADPDRAAGVAEPPGEADAPVSVHLAAGPGAIDGRVWRGDDPEPGALVTIHLEPVRPTGLRGALRILTLPPESGPALATARSNAEGRFRFSGLESGTYLLRATATDGARAHTVRGVAGGRAGSVRLTLRAGGEVLRGRAVYAHGGPFRGLVFLMDGRDGRVRTDGEGRFRIEGLSPGTPALVLLDPGRMRSVRRVEVPHDGELVIVVDDKLEMLRGRVVAADDGSPVSGATVQVDGIGVGGIQIVATADSAGRFLMPVPEEGHLRVFAAGFAPSTYAKWTRGEEAVIRLERSARVSGLVIDRDSRAPVAGVPVRVGTVRIPSLREPPVARSDDDGRYEFADVGPGPVTLLALGNGRVSEGLSGATDWYVNPLSITTEAGRPIEHDLVVVRTGRVEGLVLGPDGKPAAGVGVEVRTTRDWRGFFHGRDGVTGADGTFVVDDLVPGVPYDVTAVPADGAAAKSEAPIRTEPGGAARVDLRLPSPRWIDVVVSERGTGKAVVMAGVTGNGDVRHHALSDDDGAARLGPFAPGPVRVRVDHGHYLCPHEDTVVPATDDHVAIDLERGLPLAGRVVLPEGVDRRSAFVGLADPEAVSRRHRTRTSSRPEEDGSFRLGPVPAGRYEVVVSVFRRRSVEALRAWCEAGREDLVLTVPPLPPEETVETPDHGQLVIRLVGPDGKRPIGGRVLVYAKGMVGPTERWRVVGSIPFREGETSSAWRVTVPGRPIVLEALGAKAADGTPLGAARLEPMEEKAGEVVVRLPAGRTIAGRVLGPEGEGMRGLRVSAYRQGAQSPPVASTTTEEHGRFVLRGLGDGEHRVQVIAPRDFITPDGVAAPSGAGDVVIRLEVAGRIEVRVLRPDGTAPSGIVAMLVSTAGPRKIRSMPVGEGGRARFDRLVPGTEYELRVHHGRENLAVSRGGVRPGPDEVVVRLEPGLTIRGRISGVPAGTAVAVWAERDGGIAASSSVAANGEFEVRGLTAGVWKLWVGRSDRSETLHETEARAGETVEIVLER